MRVRDMVDASMANALASLLASVRARIARLPRDLELALRPPAKDEAKKRLAQAVFGRDKLPEPLATWFGAHDGQRDGEGLDPDADAFGWLGASEALRAWRFLNDPKQEILKPYSRDWLPIARNGGDDYLVLVLRGKGAGKVLIYFHDDKDRPRLAPSLEALAKRADKNLASLEKSMKQRAAIEKRGISLGGAKWQEKAPAPSVDALKSAPIGTAFHRRTLPYRSYSYRLYVKLGKGKWIEATVRGKANDADRDVSKAIKEIEKTLADKRPNEWKMSDADVAAGLSDGRVFPDGVAELRGKSARMDGYFFRRRAQLTVG